VYENQFTSPLRPLALAILTALAAVACPVFAGEDDSPLSLTLSQDFTRDNNFTKDDANKVGDTISTTAAQASLNKPYGRQNYQAGLKLSKQKHAHFKELNFDGKDATGAFSTEVARNWLLSANGAYSETLNPVQNNGLTADRIDKNVKKYRDGGFSAQYGNGGTWAIAGSLDANKQRYSSVAQQGGDSDQRTTGMKAIYFATDALQYSLGGRRVVTKYESNPTYAQIVDRNIDLSTQLQITGLTNLRATLTRRASSYTPTDPVVVLPSNSGWTGDFNWQYTPHGIFSYNIGFSRTTGTDRTQKTFDQDVDVNVSRYGHGTDTVTSKVNNNTVTSTLSLSARAQLTGKMSLSSGYNISQFKVDRVYAVDYTHALDLSSENSTSVKSYNRVLTFGLDYAALRSLRLGCSYQRYSQGADGLYHLKYSGNSIDCSANFTLNP
jgi:hypothetical protein